MWSRAVLSALSVVDAFAINSAALAGLYRLLTGATLPWRTILPGSLLGGAAVAVLQLAVGLLFVYTPSNPLLATFSVLIGFLLWFGIVILVAASWIAVAATDPGHPAAGAAGGLARTASRRRCGAARIHLVVITARSRCRGARLG